MSIMVLSERKRLAPSVTIRSAAASSILPSRMKCCLRMSGRGFPVRGSNTSPTVSLCDGGNGTPTEKRENNFQNNNHHDNDKTLAPVFNLFERFIDSLY